MKRLLLLTIFILFVPAVASAWNFGITVTNTTAGIAAGNKATVTYGTTSTIVTSGTRWFYPSNTIPSVTVYVSNLSNVQSITVDSQPVSIASPVVVLKGTAASHTMSVVYSSSTTQRRDITLTQTGGGLSYLRLGSATSTTGFTGIAVGTNVDLVAQPNSGYRLTKFTINGTDDFTGAGSTAAVTKTFAVDAAFTPNTVSATYELVPQITAALSVPPYGSVGVASTAAASATANVTPLVYSFTTTCSAQTQQGPSNSFTFTPAATGTCTVSVTVTHEATNTTSPTVTRTMTVVSASEVDNYACISCHAGNTPQIVDDYNRSAHNGNSGSTCSACHIPAGSTLHPHYTNINADTVSGATFQVLTSHLISGFNKGDTFCSKCHSSTIPTEFAEGPHYSRAGSNSCSFCHGIHYVDAACVNCHTPGNPYGLPWPPTGFTFHTAYTGTDRCAECHGVHNPDTVTGMPYPHFSSYTTAQYVTTNIACDNCHSSQTNSNLNIYPATREWARSGKADPRSPSWTTYDFKARGSYGSPDTSGDDCVRCHTTTGYVNYVSSGFTNIAPWGIAGTLPGGDRTREMIACNACHAPTPFNASFSRRRVGIQPFPFDPARHVIAYYVYSSAATKKIVSGKAFDDKGESNICIACHSGKNIGGTIKSIAALVGASGSFWQNVDFMNPHYMGAAGILFQVAGSVKTGYEFRVSEDYDPLINFAHPSIGDGVQGPCVGCHMTGSVQKHRFSPVSSASNGVISAITSTTCGTCHGTVGGPIPLDAGTLQTDREGYQAAVAVVASLLKSRGIHYNAAKYPYFFTTGNAALQSYVTRTVNWEAGTPAANGSDVMGACFNLKLLEADKGCWAHNNAYTKRLLYDTVDFLDDGDANNSTTAVAIQNSDVAPDVKTKAAAYIGVRP